MVKISIVTTTFNAAGTVCDCLKSIEGQTYGAVEHIVVDAASTDGTPGILEKYKESLARVVSEPDDGIYDGMNKGLELATGDVVGILNADDMYSSADTLKKVAHVFEDESVDACYGDLVYINENKGGSGCKVQGARKEDFSHAFEVSEVTRLRMTGGGNVGTQEASPHPNPLPRERGLEKKDYKVVRYWKSGEFDFRKFYWGWMPPHPTFFVRRSVYEKYGYFNLAMGTAADYELMLRFLVKHKISVAYIPEVLVHMRSGGASNVTLKSRLLANRMDRKAWEVNGLKPYPWTLWMKPLRKLGQWFSRPRS